MARPYHRDGRILKVRWMKHLTMAHDDEVVAELLETCGAEFYGVFWLLCEHIAAPMEPGKMNPRASHSFAKWASICHCSARVFRSIAGRMAEKNLIILESTEDRVAIIIPNILKYKDEYAKKSGHSPEQEQKESRERAEGEQIQIPPLSGDAPPVITTPEEIIPKSAKKKSHPLPHEIIPEEWASYPMTKLGWTRERTEDFFETMRLWAISKASTYANWTAAWQGWCRRENEKPRIRTGLMDVSNTATLFPVRESATERAIRGGTERVARGERL